MDAAMESNYWLLPSPARSYNQCFLAVQYSHQYSQSQFCIQPQWTLTWEARVSLLMSLMASRSIPTTARSSRNLTSERRVKCKPAVEMKTKQQIKTKKNNVYKFIIGQFS